jgi:hypothetical protein
MYNQHHGTKFRKKHILSKHLVAWGRWTNVNIILVAKDWRREKFKQRTIVGYGVITNHFGNTTPYRKSDVGWKQFMEDLLFVTLHTCLSLLWIIIDQFVGQTNYLCEGQRWVVICPPLHEL